MLTLDELQAYLKDQQSDFALIPHEIPLLSTEDAKTYFDIGKAAPTLILQSEEGLLAFIMSSQRGRADFQMLKEQLGCSKLKMADKSKVVAETGYRPGAVSLVGHRLPCLFDTRLLQFDYIYGGSGDPRCTLKIAPSDVVRLNHVIQFIS